jgi:hypothetical protein
MWKKIHSNRDPRDTLYSELQKEFSVYFGRAGHLGKSFLGRYPRFFFGGMVLLILVSMVLSFTLFRHPVPAPVEAQKKTINPVQDGFSQIMRATGKIRETLRLKHFVDSISAKKQLSSSDSTMLDSALNQLQRIHSSIK